MSVAVSRSAGLSAPCGVPGRSSTTARTIPIARLPPREEGELVTVDQGVGDSVALRHQPLRVVGGERAEHGKAERAADLLGNVGDAGSEPGVRGGNVGHGDGQKGHERVPDSEPECEGGEEDRGEERGVRPHAA